jgi:hypothetical protein
VAVPKDASTKIISDISWFLKVEAAFKIGGLAVMGELIVGYRAFL